MTLSPEIIFAVIALVANALAVLAGIGYHAGRITKTLEQLATIVKDHEIRIRMIEQQQQQQPPTVYIEPAALPRS